MRVFLAFGYQSHESWVWEQVRPILEAFDITVDSGRELRGKPIDDEVRRLIKGSDAVVGFLLRRSRNYDLVSWTTSDYVRQEIEIGLAEGKSVIQVVERGVPAPGGFLDRLQRLPYRSKARDAFLVEFTSHIRAWVQGAVFVRLTPQALLDDIDAAGDPTPSCDYEIMDHDGNPVLDKPQKVRILTMGGSLVVKLTGFRPGCYADLAIMANGRRWRCKGVGYTQPSVTMQLDPVP
jgi:hypothetical protein